MDGKKASNEHEYVAGVVFGGGRLGSSPEFYFYLWGVKKKMFGINV